MSQILTPNWPPSQKWVTAAAADAGSFRLSAAGSRPCFNGEIMNVGADWQTVFSSGLAELDTRYAFRTDDGAVIEITNFGFRHGPPDVMRRVAAGEDVDPSSYYMRTHARLETGHPDYEWVNRTLFIGVGARLKSNVRLSLYAID